MIIDNILYDKVLFIHIPKTGGSSINYFLENKNFNNWNKTYPYGHDPYFLLEKNNINIENAFTFSVVRNPYTRIYSYYKHFNKHNMINISFECFLELLYADCYFPKTPLIKYNQCYYLKSISGKINLKKIYYFENLSELEKDFNIHLPHINKGNYSAEEYYKDYTELCICKVQEIYNEDFKTLGYSKKFNETSSPMQKHIFLRYK
jgi:hypothetical protein